MGNRGLAIVRIEEQVSWTVVILVLLAAFPDVRSIEIIGKDEVTFRRSDTCSAAHQTEVWNSVLRCQPRPTLIELPVPVTPGSSGPIMQVMPGHVMVDRCSGSCHTHSHSCLPTEIRNKTVEIMAVQTTYSSGAWNTLCSAIQVETHLGCKCMCAIQSSDCLSSQWYDEASCQCRCRDQASRYECLMDPSKTWDESTCSCMCERSTWRSCSTGFTFDYIDTCSCIRTYSMASSAGLAVLVAASAVGLIAISAYVFHLKRKQEIMSRRSSFTPSRTHEDANNENIEEQMMASTSLVSDENEIRRTSLPTVEVEEVS